jgi:hypothetical protein
VHEGLPELTERNGDKGQALMATCEGGGAISAMQNSHR